MTLSDVKCLCEPTLSAFERQLKALAGTQRHLLELGGTLVVSQPNEILGIFNVMLKIIITQHIQKRMNVTLQANTPR